MDVLTRKQAVANIMNVYSEQIYVSRGEINNPCGYLKPSLGCQSREGESSRIVKYGELSSPSRDRRMHPEEGPEVLSKGEQGALSAKSYTAK